LNNAIVITMAEALRTNYKLTTLELPRNEFDIQGTVCLVTSLVNNTTLTSLGLSMNHIGDRDVLHFAHMMKKNTTLATLDLSYNAIGHKGITTFLNAFHLNSTLTALTLTGSYNLFGHKQSIENQAELNKTLKHFCTWPNSFSFLPENLQLYAVEFLCCCSLIPNDITTIIIKEVFTSFIKKKKLEKSD